MKTRSFCIRWVTSVVERCSVAASTRWWRRFEHGIDTCLRGEQCKSMVVESYPAQSCTVLGGSRRGLGQKIYKNIRVGSGREVAIEVRWCGGRSGGCGKSIIIFMKLTIKVQRKRWYLARNNVTYWTYYLRAVGRKVLWSSAYVCLCALCLSARYLKNGFMDHHQIWWVGPGGEPVEQVQFWCW